MRIRIVDAFTDRPFRGNPAGVCLLEDGQWPDVGWMQRVAAELTRTEMAFVLPLTGNDAAEYGLRWFTPEVEVGLCGHATLATVHVLATEGLIGDGVRFDSASGILVAEVGDEWITLDFPVAELTERPVPDGLSEALGADVLEVRHTGELGDLLVVVEDEKTVRALRPDAGALTSRRDRDAKRGYIVTAKADEDAGYDFVSRFFAPAIGIPEDPVTGSAHTALAPYWRKEVGRDAMTGFQASSRGGLVRAEIAGDRVRLTGRAVTVLDGALHATPGSA